MRLTVSFIIVAIYAFGSVFSDPSKLFSPTVTIHIEHTHEIDSEHDHHHHDTENDLGHNAHEDDHDHDKQNEHKESVPHSHNVSISMSGGYVVGAPSIDTILINDQLESVYSTVFNDRVPENRTLSSIFRPPIV